MHSDVHFRCARRGQVVLIRRAHQVQDVHVRCKMCTSGVKGVHQMQGVHIRGNVCISGQVQGVHVRYKACMSGARCACQMQGVYLRCTLWGIVDLHVQKTCSKSKILCNCRPRKTSRCCIASLSQQGINLAIQRVSRSVGVRTCTIYWHTAPFRGEMLLKN